MLSLFKAVSDAASNFDFEVEVLDLLEIIDQIDYEILE